MPIMLVGDPNQLLYRFAGANPEILMNGIDELIPIETIKLEVNYRSVQSVIEASQALISYNYTENNGPYNQDLFQDLKANSNENGCPIQFNEYGLDILEAKGTIQEVELLLSGEYKPEDIFISARTKAQLGYLEGELLRAEIPFINASGGSFWGSKHVQDVISYVKLACNNKDKTAFKRVYNIASKSFKQPFNSHTKSKGDYNSHRWLNTAFMTACNDDYSQVWKALSFKQGWRWKQGVNDLNELVASVQHALVEGGLPLAIQTVIDDCYHQYLQETEGIIDDGDSNKLEDLETVKSTASEYDSPQEFFDYVDNTVKALENTKNGSWEGVLVLSTVHKLKGLERPVVFGIGFSESDEEGLLPHTFSLRAAPGFGLFPTSGINRIEDERCIAFVLISRAKKRVYLSGCQSWGNKEELGVSRFIKEMGIDLDKEQE